MKHLNVLAAGCLLALAGTSPSAASVNLEYFQEYEARFIELCTRLETGSACQRKMERLQEELGFETFAEMMMQQRDETIVAAIRPR